jgi:unsaturated chondroitin disaccharide hydrolase
LGTLGGQAYAEGSSWSRGVSWALYGFILSYIHTKEERYLETSKKVAQHFVESVEKTGYLPLIDFKAPETPVLYDSTAGAIAACGLIELAKNVEEGQQAYYISAALNILKEMENNWCNWTEEEDSILQMGSERYTGGHHMPIIYGDYFFTEAISKLKGVDFLPW